MQHSYLLWVQKTRRVRQAVLVEPAPRKPNTPEHFYYNEMLVRSTLEERYLARGGRESRAKTDTGIC